MKIADRIAAELNTGGPATFDQLATRLSLNAPSVRRTMQGLVRQGRCYFSHYADASATDKVWAAR